MSRRHLNNGPSDIGAIRDARAGHTGSPAPQKRRRRRQDRHRNIDREALRQDAIARWLVSDKD